MTMPRKLTESAAWRSIAQTFFTEGHSFANSTYLCGAISDLITFDRISRDRAEYMEARLDAYMRDGFGNIASGWAYYPSYHSARMGDEQRHARGMAALWMAEDAEHEEKENLRMKVAAYMSKL